MNNLPAQAAPPPPRLPRRSVRDSPRSGCDRCQTGRLVGRVRVTAGPAGKLGHLAGTPGCGVPGASRPRSAQGTAEHRVVPAAREFPTCSGGEFEPSCVLGLESRSLITVKRGGAFGHNRGDLSSTPPRPSDFGGVKTRVRLDLHSCRHRTAGRRGPGDQI